MARRESSDRNRAIEQFYARNFHIYAVKNMLGI